MVLNTSSVDLEAITSSVDRSQFDENELEYLANLFLKSGDTVSPILLFERSPVAFEVLEGHQEYYAALKAQEIDSSFESIRAYIVPTDREEVILEQYRLLHSNKLANRVSEVSSNVEPSSNLEKIISEIRQVKQLVSKSIDDSKQRFSDVNTTLVSLDSRIPKLPDPQPISQFLKDLNELDEIQLNTKLSKAGYKGKALSKLLNGICQERKRKQFISFNDLISKSRKIDGKRLISEVTLIKLLDNW